MNNKSWCVGHIVNEKSIQSQTDVYLHDQSQPGLHDQVVEAQNQFSQVKRQENWSCLLQFSCNVMKLTARLYTDLMKPAN